MEDDIEHPVQPVFDPPVGSFGMREGLGFELCRREIAAPLALASASALDAGLEHADHGQNGKARFISEASIREQPSDVVADQMAALFQAPVPDRRPGWPGKRNDASHDKVSAHDQSPASQAPSATADAPSARSNAGHSPRAASPQTKAPQSTPSCTADPSMSDGQVNLPTLSTRSPSTIPFPEDRPGIQLTPLCPCGELNHPAIARASHFVPPAWVTEPIHNNISHVRASLCKSLDFKEAESATRGPGSPAILPPTRICPPEMLRKPADCLLRFGQPGLWLRVRATASCHVR
jgi:hypothetical protein